MEILAKNAEATQEFGRSFANSLKGSEILALTGDLGSGKTTFVQGLAQGLGIKERVLSPTFVLMREYKVKLKSKNLNGKTTAEKLKVRNFYHIDLYRLEENVEKELRNLGIEEIWGEPGNVVAIEWAEKVRGALPKGVVWVKFEHLEEGRKITLEAKNLKLKWKNKN